eukprot:m.30608 g.30608  ORF g.30608 m.30608 type:complete len:108 (+) comp9653_c0_seq1:628-951(+)
MHKHLNFILILTFCDLGTDQRNMLHEQHEKIKKLNLLLKEMQSGIINDVTSLKQNVEGTVTEFKETIGSSVSSETSFSSSSPSNKVMEVRQRRRMRKLEEMAQFIED